MMTLSSLLSQLDQGTKLTVNDEEIFVYVFTLAFIEDMSQQQINFNCKDVEANKDCRFCLISIEEQSNLNYDGVMNEHYHHETLTLRRNDDLMLQIKKEKFFRQ